MNGAIAADCPDDSQVHLRPPRRYEVIRELASGGMATVWLARGEGALGVSRFVAIKRLHPHLATDGDFVKMFLDEANLASRIKHPNVVPVIDVFELDGLSLVMEYIEGETLLGLWRLAFRNNERLPVAIAARVMLDALAGLQAAHELRDEAGQHLKIIHRDVSPQNILVGIDGVTRITDFGIAKATSRLAHTREGLVKGKFAYMAPEQFNQGEVDQRVDVFTAGLVAWELFSGTRMFPTEPDAVIIKRLMTERVTEITERAPDVPDAVARAVMRALERDPAERWPTCGAFAEALAAASESFGGPSPQRNVGVLTQRLIAAERRRLAPPEGSSRASSPRLRAIDAEPRRASSPAVTAIEEIVDVHLSDDDLTDEERAEANLPATPVPAMPGARRTFVPMPPRPTLPRIPSLRLPMPPSRSSISSSSTPSIGSAPSATKSTPPERVSSPPTPPTTARASAPPAPPATVSTPPATTRVSTPPTMPEARASAPPAVPVSAPPTELEFGSVEPEADHVAYAAIDDDAVPEVAPQALAPKAKRAWWYVVPVLVAAGVLIALSVRRAPPSVQTTQSITTTTSAVSPPTPPATPPVVETVTPPSTLIDTQPPVAPTSDAVEDARPTRRRRHEHSGSSIGMRRTRDGRIIIR